MWLHNMYWWSDVKGSGSRKARLSEHVACMVLLLSACKHIQFVQTLSTNYFAVSLFQAHPCMAQEYCLLECDTVKSGTLFPTFWCDMLPPFSGQKSQELTVWSRPLQKTIVNPVCATYSAHLFYIDLPILTTSKPTWRNIISVEVPWCDVPVQLSSSKLVFGRCSIRISAGTPAILTASFRGFPQFLHTNTGIISRLGHDRFPQNPFQFIIHQTSDNSTLYSMFQKSMVKRIPHVQDVAMIKAVPVNVGARMTHSMWFNY
jgi:hypothetical protein